MKRQLYTKIKSNNKTRILILTIVGCWALASALLPIWNEQQTKAQAPPAVLMVNQETDAGDGVCDMTCTLRDAVLTANAASGADTINFDSAVTEVAVDNSEIVITDALTIKGRGANILTINGSSSHRIFYIAQVNVAITDIRIRGGGGGGALLNNSGGAIASNGATLLLDRVDLTDNTAFSGSGAVNIQDGHLRIRNSTISDNSAPSCSGITVGGFSNSLQVVNSTFSGNWVSSSTGVGGAVCTTAEAAFRNVTITGNSANRGGGIFQNANELYLANTIVAGNTAATSNPEIFFQSGILISSGFNLIGDSAGDAADTGMPITYQTTDILNQSPMLLSLGDSGGPTRTHPLQPGSPAINAGSQNFARDLDGSSLQTDQRGLGFPRLRGIEVDIGSFEIQTVPTAASVSVSGRILTAHGRGVSNAQVSITGAAGEPRTALTNQFGYYRFEDVSVGESYILTARHKRYQFSPQILTVFEEITDFDLTAKK